MRATPFNDNWYVWREDGESSCVGPVQLPHDAMLAEPRTPTTPNGHNTGYWPGGVYRYRKTFTAPVEWADRSVSLEFEGVYCRSEVLCNGRLVGGRPNGYTLFHVNLNEALKFGEENVLEVIVNNDRVSSRWYTGSGIYRPVHLLVGGQARITPQGMFVETVALSHADAILEVSVDLINDTEAARAVIVEITIVAPDGRRIASSQRLDLEPGATTAKLPLEVPDAHLWSTDDPALHTLTCTLLSDDGQELDRAVDMFGIRTISVDAEHGFRLNGRTIKLRGSCVHHDNGPIGAIELDDAADRRIRLLKKAGFNAIRSSHNPASSAVLRACDRHGVLVMEELTDVWLRMKVVHDYSLEFSAWWERDLESMIRKARSHPSVVLYSIGNEIGETATPAGIDLNRRMVERCHELDPTRPVTNGINGLFNLMADMDDEKIARLDAEVRAGRKKPKGLVSVLNVAMSALMKITPYLTTLRKTDRRTRDAFAALDVAGYNYMPRRYRKDAAGYPDRVIVGSETMPSHTVAIWRDVEALPNLIGDFTWTGWDHIGEASVGAAVYDSSQTLYQPYPARLAGQPLIDINGYFQPLCYRNQILWGHRQAPYIAVRPLNRHGQKVRMSPWRPTDAIRSWSWDGYEGKPATVIVYSDAAAVDLYLDGRTVGTTQPDVDTLAATFTVPYRAGELVAIARDAAGLEVGRDTLTSGGPELHLHVESDTRELRADGDSLAFLDITLGDQNGIVKPLADRAVQVDVAGVGTLAGFGSANPITEEGFVGNTATTFQGRALAVVRSGSQPGEVQVTVTAEGCEPVVVTLPVD